MQNHPSTNEFVKTSSRRKRIAAIIDRCNFNRDQRNCFTSMAAEMGVVVDCIVFTYSKEACILRCKERNIHETMCPEEAEKAVARSS
mmetsp:Transcript_18429/g.26904  ORF Transcript_18429/g.26904 Transcript_18429/m.26904 type:complete len:87 (-) Transcript_18429:73-333(-)